MSAIVEERRRELDAAIDSLYTVFREYKFTDVIGDPAFPGFCDPATLRAAPLRELPATAFGRLAEKSMTTWGTVDDFRHFLPRLLELVVDEWSVPGTVDPLQKLGLDGLSPDIVFYKLRYGGYSTWKRREVEAIDTYLTRLWAWVLANPADTSSEFWSSYNPSVWLHDMCEACDVGVRFDEWVADCRRGANAQNATCHLANLAAQVAYDTPILRGGHSGESVARLSAELCASGVVATLLETHFCESADSQIAQRLSDALEIHEAWLARQKNQ
ncbi:MAG: hypothetical protein AAF790_00810 [Planctomycetota bacterium]